MMLIRKITYIVFLILMCVFISCNTPYGSNKDVGKYYDIRGFKMYCEIYGNGQPVLMIHGNNGSINTFKGSIPYFSKKYKVIIADSRAQGKSVDSKDSISFEMMADDYAILLDSLQIDSANIIGWSDGGINALLLAMRHPNKVRSLVASGANLWPDSTAITPKEWLNEQKEYNRIIAKNGSNPNKKQEDKMFWLDWEQPHIQLNELHNIKCPSLIMCGDHDVIRVDHTTQIAQNIPRSNLWVVPNSGHGILFEHTKDFNKNIDKFFRNSFNPKKDFNK